MLAGINKCIIDMILTKYVMLCLRMVSW